MDWGKDGISELVEAAECITHNNLSWDGKPLYDIDNYFQKWVREHIKKRLSQYNSTVKG